MQGGPDKLDGLIQQTFNYLEAALKEKTDDEYKLSCRMITVYYFEMTDLLLPKNGRCCKLFIKKDKEHNIVRVEGATMVPVDFRQAQ